MTTLASEDTVRQLLDKQRPVEFISNATGWKPADVVALQRAEGAKEYDDLITEGRSCPSKRVRASADRAKTQLDKLKAELGAYHAKGEARAEVERLEKQLREAKAKLRPARAQAQPSGNAGEIRSWAKVNGVACPPMGRVPQAVVEKWKTATGK